MQADHLSWYEKLTTGKRLHNIVNKLCSRLQSEARLYLHPWIIQWADINITILIHIKSVKAFRDCCSKIPGTDSGDRQFPVDLERPADDNGRYCYKVFNSLDFFKNSAFNFFFSYGIVHIKTHC
jgi:hypothetical protein